MSCQVAKFQQIDFTVFFDDITYLSKHIFNFFCLCTLFLFFSVSNMSIVETLVASYQDLDTYISGKTFEFLDFVGAGVNETTPLTAHLPFVDSPTPLVLFLASYFLILGIFYPLISWKQSKNPMSCKNNGPILRAFVMFHNFFLAGVSLWMGVMMIYYVITTNYTFWGSNFDPTRDTEICFVMYVFYISKFYEFIDTYIMLLKGNLSQVSFLHVYHHASTCVIFWMVSKHAPGGDAWFCITINCWVHVVMYTYYLLTTIITDKGTRKKYLWWGIYLTQFQMSQFFINLIHSIWCFNYSPYWYFGKVLQAIDMSVLLILFGNFYIKKYLTKPTIQELKVSQKNKIVNTFDESSKSPKADKTAKPKMH